MTPEQFLRAIAKQTPAPVYLFIGPETYRRRACRTAIVERVLDPEQCEEGVTRHDLEDDTLSAILDDARSMSLFASNRVIWVAGAEAALPRGKAAASDDEGDGKQAGSAEALEAYCKDPTPGTVVIFNAQKYDFDGEDKARNERVLKFYKAVPEVVEFRKMTPQDARAFAQSEASQRGLRLGGDELELLVDATASDPARIANEIEKLALFAQARGGNVSVEDVFALVPNASETTIFGLVNALARRDRTEAMELLDMLVREGEYLPLALTFLGGVFRFALTAKEQGLRSSNDVQNYFQRQGVPMWRARAEQIYTASARFSKEKLEEGIRLVFRADRDLKSTRPDDRLVLEDFLFRLTG